MASGEHAGVEWVNKHRREIGDVCRRAVERTAADTSIRVPTSPEERQNGFALWLQGYRERLPGVVQEEFERAFPGIARQFENPTLISGIVEQQVWPEVEDYLHRYAIRGSAVAWANQHLSRGTTIGMPERCGNRWRIPLALRGCDEDLGQVMLDRDGNVLAAESSTRDALQEEARARTFSRAEAARP